MFGEGEAVVRWRVAGTYTRGASTGPWSIEAPSVEEARRQAEALGILVREVTPIPDADRGGTPVPSPVQATRRTLVVRGLDVRDAAATLGCMNGMLGLVTALVTLPLWAFRAATNNAGVIFLILFGSLAGGLIVGGLLVFFLNTALGIFGGVAIEVEEWDRGNRAEPS
jgi:hypothetical protein